MRKHVEAALLIAMAILSLASVLFLPIFSLTRASETDCTYLLKSLDDTLRYALILDPYGEFLAKNLLNASTPPELYHDHVRIYRSIVEYYEITLSSYPRDLLEILSSLVEIYNNLYYADNYISALYSCSHDKHEASSLRDSALTDLYSLRYLIANTVSLVNIERYENLSINVYPDKRIYSPGEEIRVEIKSNTSMNLSIFIATWPQQRALGKEYQCRGSLCVYSFETPTADKLVEKNLTRYTLGNMFYLALVISFSGNQSLVARVFVVSYSSPKILIEAPQSVKRGSVFNATIYFNDNYNATIYLNNNMILRKNFTNNTSITLTIDTLSKQVSLGRNSIRVCIDATRYTLPQCLEKSFVVEPIYPNITLVYPEIFYTWIDKPVITLRNNENRSFKILVLIDNETIYSGDLVETLSISIPYTLSLYREHILRLDIEDPSGLYSELIMSRGIVVINLLSLSVIAGGSVLAIYSIIRYGRRLLHRVSTPRETITEAPQPRTRALAEGSVETRELTSRSYLASLYYSLLKRLGIRYPLPHETLREHFRESIDPVPKIITAIKNLLWRMLLYAERDLYSRDKPDHDEVKKIYDEIESIKKSK